MNIKKLCILAALLAGACSSANAALITYSYDNGIRARYGDYEVIDAVGLFTVDDRREGLVSVEFASAPATFSWKGYAPLMHDEVVATESRIHENGIVPFTAEDVNFFLWLDWFWLNAGENIFHHLDEAHLYEGAGFTTLDNEYLLRGHLTKIRTVEVHETYTLALLALGLLTLGAQARLKKG